MVFIASVFMVSRWNTRILTSGPLDTQTSNQSHTTTVTPVHEHIHNDKGRSSIFDMQKDLSLTMDIHMHTVYANYCFGHKLKDS